MDFRQSGNDGEGCRNDGEEAGNDGLVLWSPYPKLGLTGTFTSPYGKGWSARMAGHSRTLSTTLPQRPTRPWGLTPPSPYPKPGLYYFRGQMAQATIDAGIRAVTGPHMIGLPVPDFPTPAASLAEAAAFMERYEDHLTVVPTRCRPCPLHNLPG